MRCKICGNELKPLRSTTQNKLLPTSINSTYTCFPTSGDTHSYFIYGEENGNIGEETGEEISVLDKETSQRYVVQIYYDYKQTHISIATGQKISSHITLDNIALDIPQNTTEKEFVEKIKKLLLLA
jgi:hypothetical protein